MLNELAYKGEIHSFDLLTMECVANANSNITKSTPNETIAQMQLMFSEMQLPRKYGITREALKSLYDHSFDGDLDFAALSVCDVILNNGVILSHWGKAHVIKDETSSICAPIEIDGKRYYAVLISGRNNKGFKYPYAMRVFSDEYIKNELLEIYRTSPQNEMIPRQNADFQKFAANLLINYIINNSDLSFLSNIEQNNNAEQDNSSIKTQDNNKENINCNKNIMYKNKQDKGMNNKVRLTEKQLHSVIKESVTKILNEIGNYKQPKRKFDPNRYNGGGRADIEGGLPMNFEHDNDDPSEYRDYFGKHDKMYEDTDYTWEYDYADKNGKGIGGKHKEPKKNPLKIDYKDGDTLPNGFIKKGDYAVHPRLADTQLHQIVKESINSVLNEAYNTRQYANLAGQANGALNTFGGKIKGLFNPKWKARKQRQEKLFGRGGDSYYNRVGSSAMADNTENSSYQHDYFFNRYNNERRGENPYEIERSQYNMPNAFDIQHGKQDGQTMSRQEFRNKYGINGQNIEGYDDVGYENSSLNNAYQQGRNVAMGKYKDGEKTYGGTPLNGTGTRNGAFQHYGEDE